MAGPWRKICASIVLCLAAALSHSGAAPSETDLQSDDFSVHGVWMLADIFVYSDKSGCSKGEANIGSCVNYGHKENEQYLCDPFTNEVYISMCKNEDCSDCGPPKENWYSYKNGVCQDNGWLKAKCTQIPWEAHYLREKLTDEEMFGDEVPATENVEEQFDEELYVEFDN